MNTDIRLSVKFFSHIKTFLLDARCGKEGIVCLLKLWVWAAENRPSGDLSGFSSKDLEFISGWSGERGCFGEALRDIKWLDGEEGSFRLHGWEEFQTWVTGGTAREDAARLSNLARKNNGAYTRLKAMGFKGIDKELYAKMLKPGWEDVIAEWGKAVTTQVLRQSAQSSAPSPSPSPYPSPTLIKDSKGGKKSNPKNENPKTDFERKWEGEYAQKVNPLDYIRKIQEIAKNSPKIPERILGVSGGQCPPELQSDTGLESEVNTNGKDNEEDDERRRAVGQGH